MCLELCFLPEKLTSGYTQENQRFLLHCVIIIHCYFFQTKPHDCAFWHICSFITVIIISLIFGLITHNSIEYLSGVRCFLPNNYLIYEMTRPISDCEFCIGVEAPLELPNVTKAEFMVIFNNIMHF